MHSSQKEAQVKLTKGLLDMIVLELLKNEPMYGYQLITNIHRGFGVCLDPSTVYPLLGMLEKKRQVKSEWDMTHERPRKVYSLTPEGQNLLSFTENSLNLICRTLSSSAAPEVDFTIRSCTCGKGGKNIAVPA